MTNAQVALIAAATAHPTVNEQEVTRRASSLKLWLDEQDNRSLA